MPVTDHNKRILSVIKQNLVQPGPRRNPFAQTCHLVALPFAGPPATSLAARKRVRLALVSMPPIRGTPIQYDTTSTRAPDVDKQAQGRVLLEQDRKQRGTFTDAYLQALNYCCEKLKADIVVFNELALPTVDGRPARPVMNALWSTADRRGCLIVSGTHHDARTLMNTGYIFYPSSGKWGVPFHKCVSATSVSVDERISIPPARRIFCIKAFGLSISVLVCLDLADYGVVAAAVRSCDDTDVILVCCYTEWFDALEKVAAVASDAIAGLVLMVNCQRTGYGSSCRTLERGVSRGIRLAKSFKLGAEVYIKNVDSHALRRAKDQTLTDRKPDNQLNWLFGQKVLAVQRR